MERLKGKVAVVTGAGSGIGYAITKLYIEEGAKVIASDISESIERLTEEFGENVLPVVANSGIQNDVASMLNKGIEHFGRIDIVVNNAGISGPIIKTHELTEERFKKTLDVNLLGPFYAIKNIVPHFLENGKGCIINIASISTFPTFTAAADYTSSKAGVKRLTESAAYEYAENNIRVNAIAPGHIETPIYDGIEDHKAKMAEKIPLKRFGQPEEIATVAVNLATDDFSYVTGQTIVVDGGRLMS